MKILLDMNLAEVVEEFASINLPKYKAKQVYNWVLRGVDFDDMTDIDKKTRAILKEKYIAVPAKIFYSSLGYIVILNYVNIAQESLLYK